MLSGLEWGAFALIVSQSGLMTVDEWIFHRRRGLGKWESWGHPLDSLLFLLPLTLAALAPPNGFFFSAYLVGSIASALFITKDEWVHASACHPMEHWLHAVLFVLHPSLLWAVGLLWLKGEGAALRAGLPLLVGTFTVYQILASLKTKRSVESPKVDNSFYDALGDRWYDDDKHAIALLRVEGRQKLVYVKEVLSRLQLSRDSRILDIACGAGFMSNPLAAEGYDVKGVDLSAGSVEIAKRKAPAGARVAYEVQNAYELREADQSFDVVLMLDFLEHVDDPSRAIKEAARVLKRGGVLISHTFSRNCISGFLAIKGIALLTRDCPEHVHVYSLLLNPEELVDYSKRHGLDCEELRGIRPRVNWPFLWSFLNRRIHPAFEFTFCKSLVAGYLGTFRKP